MLYLRSDAQRNTEGPLPAGDVIGIVAKIERGGRVFKMNARQNFKSRALQKAWLFKRGLKMIFDRNDAYFQRILFYAAGIDWACFARLCRIHNVEALAYSALKAADAAMQEPVKKELRQGFLAAAALACRQNEAYRILANALEEREIPYVPLKGLVVKDYYPHPDFRTRGDVDILVRRDDLTACHQVLTQMGYTRLAYENEILYKRDSVRFEIHYKIKHACSADGAEVLRDHTVPGGASYRRAFTKRYQIVLLLDHMAAHAFSGFGIRMLPGKLKAARRLMFPTCTAMSSRGYANLDRRPYVLPIAWLHRGLVKLIRHNGTTMLYLCRVLNGGPAGSLKRIMQEFGL